MSQNGPAVVQKLIELDNTELKLGVFSRGYVDICDRGYVDICEGRISFFDL